MFSYERIQTNLKRSKPLLSKHAFLHQIAAEECIASLSPLSIHPASILILGHFPAIDTLKESYRNATYRVLDGFTPNIDDLPKYDLIISIGQIHWLNNPEDYLNQVRNILNHKGVFYGAFPGEDSFTEVNKALVQAEMQLINGAHQRMIPMIKASDALTLLQHTKFTNPLVHVVSIELKHDTIMQLLKDLKHMGGGNPFKAQATITPKRLFALANQHVASKSTYVESTVDLVVMIAHA